MGKLTFALLAVAAVAAGGCGAHEDVDKRFRQANVERCLKERGAHINVSERDVFVVAAPALGGGFYAGNVTISFLRSHERAQQFADTFDDLEIANMDAAPDVHGNMVVAWNLETKALREALSACL